VHNSSFAKRRKNRFYKFRICVTLKIRSDPSDWRRSAAPEREGLGRSRRLGEYKKFGNEKNSAWDARNPLKTLKTDEKMFGKAWKKFGKSLEKGAKSLEKAWKSMKSLEKLGKAWIPWTARRPSCDVLT
jgi:hypothetical protein